MKYPVIRTKQFMPTFPAQPKKTRKKDLFDGKSAVMRGISPELTTLWCATIKNITMMRNNSMFESRTLTAAVLTMCFFLPVFLGGSY
jgi:hypothetical protein